MEKRALIAGLSCVLFLGANAAYGADHPPPAQPDRAAAQNVLPDDADLLFFLEDQNLVSATKRPIALRKAPAIATVITADQIANMGARNLEDVLKMVPGFGISTNEWGTHMIEVRGIRSGASEKILVMMDGHSLNRNTNGSALVYNMANSIPVENIRQLEIIRGPGSALYGNSAFVATINVITRSPQSINGVEVKGGGGSFQSYKGNVVGGTAIGDSLTVSGIADHHRTEGPKLTVGADALTGTPFSLAPGTADLRSRNSYAFLKLGYGDLSVRGGYQARKERVYIGIVSALTDDSYLDNDTYWGELAYSRSIGSRLATNLKLFYDHYEQDPFVKIYPNGFGGAFPAGLIGKPQVKNGTLGGELQVDWDPFAGNHLIAGVSFEEMRQYDTRQLANFDPLGGPPPSAVQEVANWNKDATRRIFAAYFQDEWQLPAQVNLTFGLRYDRYSDFGDTLNPRVGVVWSFLEKADLKLLYGSAFRAPNFQELYNVNNPVVVGNPDLKPERISTFEAGLAWRLNRYFAANLDYFYSRISDQIGWLPSTVPGAPGVNANLGTSKTQGVEVGANGALGTKLHWNLSYAYQDPRSADTDLRLPFVPSQRASASVNYAPWKYLNLHSDLLWTGTRPRPQGDARPSMPAYATVDLAVTLKNFYKSMEVQATVRNLFDERYSDPDTSSGAANFAGTGPKVPGDFPREGISWFVTAKYKF